MKSNINVINFSMCVIGWCVCMLTFLAAMAFGKCYGPNLSWTLNITLLAIVVGSMIFGLGCAYKAIDEFTSKNV